MRVLIFITCYRANQIEHTLLRVPITEIHSFVIAKSDKYECSFLSRDTDIRQNQLEHTLLRVPKKVREIDFLKVSEQLIKHLLTSNFSS